MTWLAKHQILAVLIVTYLTLVGTSVRSCSRSSDCHDKGGTYVNGGDLYNTCVKVEMVIP